MTVVSVCLPSDALSQHLSSYFGFSYLGHGVSLHGCSSKVQPLLLTLDVGYLLMATAPDLGLDLGYLYLAAAPDLKLGVSPLGRCSLPWMWGSSSQLLLWTLDLGYLLLAAAPDLWLGLSPLGSRS